MSTSDVAAVAAETLAFVPVIHGAEDSLAEAIAAFADLKAAESSAADATARIGQAFVRAMRSASGIVLAAGKPARKVSLRTFAEATGIPKATVARGARLAALREAIPTVAWPVRAADSLASSMLEDNRLTPDAAASLAEAVAKHPTDPMAAITAAKGGGNPASQSGGSRQSAKARATARKAVAEGTVAKAVAEEAAAALRVAEAVVLEATDDATKAEAKAMAGGLRVMAGKADAEDFAAAFVRMIESARFVLRGEDLEAAKAMAEAVAAAGKEWRNVVAEAKAIIG